MTIILIAMVIRKVTIHCYVWQIRQNMVSHSVLLVCTRWTGAVTEYRYGFNIINILPLDKGVMVDYHTKNFFFFFLSVIIYHNTRIHGQYIFLLYWMRFDFCLFCVLLLHYLCDFLSVFANFLLVIKKSYHNTCNKHQDK